MGIDRIQRADIDNQKNRKCSGRYLLQARWRQGELSINIPLDHSMKARAGAMEKPPCDATLFIC